MGIEKLFVWAEDGVFEYVRHRAGIEVTRFDGEVEGPTAVIIIRPPKPDLLPDLLNALEKASLHEVPVIVLSGSPDGAGQEIRAVASRCGVPPECVIQLENGKIVDGCGNELGEALRGTGISMPTVLDQASRAYENKQVPERPLWDNKWGTELADGVTGTTEQSLWDSSKDEKQAVRLSETDPGDERPEKQAIPGAPEVGPWRSYLDRADKVVAVLGIKSGVGVSTVAACLADVLGDHGSLYLEVSPSAGGYIYFGHSLAEAAAEGRYAYCADNSLPGDLQIPVLIVDASRPEALDAIYSRADCVVLVTDNSHIAFGKVGKWIQGGWKVDVLAVNKCVSGSGYPPEVYMGEYHLEKVVGIPGGTEEENAVNLAQRSATIPIGKSVDLDSAYGELARIVLAVIGK